MTQTGFASDVLYPDRFERALAPSWLGCVVNALGHAAPAQAGGHWLEIGCGTGFTASLLAAANPRMRFTGVDIHAGHIALAQERARTIGLDNLEFFTADIGAPANDTILDGPYDFIVVHGVYSWVSPHIREAIRKFIAARLGPGGLAYLHYMAQPGAAPFAVFQATFQQALTACGGDPRRAAADGLKTLSDLSRAGAGFFAAHPHARQTLDHLLAESPDYIAHEYFSDAYTPIHSANLIGEMKALGLAFVGSATPLENVDDASLPGATLDVIRRTRDPVARETLKDIARNQALRCDLFMRSPAPLDAAEHMHALGSTRYRLVNDPPPGGSITFDTRIGPVEGEAAMFGPLLSRFQQGPASFDEIYALPAFQRRPGLLNQCLQMLLWGGLIHPLAEPQSGAHETAQRFNAFIENSARQGRPMPAYCISDIGSGLPAGTIPTTQSPRAAAL